MTAKGYYINSILWSTVQKVLTAVVGLIATPLLLGVYGKADFGILSIATACNGYMHLLDLGMNTGAVRYFSIYLSDGDRVRLDSVARTNISFYTFISALNIFGLLAIAYWGEDLFAVTHEHFLTLRSCIYILAVFSLFNWCTTAFNQLLIADKQMVFTMQMSSIVACMRGGLLAVVYFYPCSLTTYFFWVTAIVSALVFPYASECRRRRLLDSFMPAFNWSDFKPVLRFSLSIFALSLFQMTATQTRPLVLGMFADDGTVSVSDFTIISVFPTLVIMIGATFTSIFLPKTSEMVARGDLAEQHAFAYQWTTITTIFANILCFPFIVGGGDILSAYVGSDYVYLYKWLVVWMVCTLMQIHSTPANALILSYGKTRIMVYVSGFACLVSMIVNAVLAPSLSVGSAVIGYAIYIVVNFAAYYGYYNHKILRISNLKIIGAFVKPTVVGTIACFIILFSLGELELRCFAHDRFDCLSSFIIKALAWTALYMVLLLIFKIIDISRVFPNCPLFRNSVKQ